MSNVIKSSTAKSNELEKKIIELKVLQVLKNNELEDKENQSAHVVIEEARRKAEKIIEEATASSQAIKQQLQQDRQNWQDEKAELIEEAKKEGFEAGLLLGKEAGLAEYSDLLKEARQVVEASRRDYLEYLESSEEVILKLGIKVAEKILGKHLESDPSDFLYLVKNAIKEAKDHSNITIHIHPSYYSFLVGQKDELLALFNRETDIYIFPSEDLQGTDCIIESSFGKIDASVDSQLIEIREKLLSFLMEE